MGNLIAINLAPTSDARIRRAMQTFDLTKQDMLVFWNVWNKHDVRRRGMISMSAFYENVVHEPRTLFGDALFDLIECIDADTLDFGEFVAGICTYCFFEIPEILKFCFYVFDRDKNGFVPATEFRLLIDALHNHNLNANAVFALDNMKHRRAGKLYFKDLAKMHELFPSVLFPAFRLQNAMMNAIGGESWWNKRKVRLILNKEAADRREKAKKRKRKRQAENYRQAQIRRHMGLYKFYFMPWQRKQYYAIYPAADAAEDEFEEGEDDITSSDRNPEIIGRNSVSATPWE